MFGAEGNDQPPPLAPDQVAESRRELSKHSNTNSRRRIGGTPLPLRIRPLAVLKAKSAKKERAESGVVVPVTGMFQ